MKTLNGGLVSAPEVKARQNIAEEIVMVCAYDDQQNFERIRIAGSMSYPEFLKKQSSLSKDIEVVFYCDCPHDELAIAKAEQLQNHGFVNATALDGGIKAWAKS